MVRGNRARGTYGAPWLTLPCILCGVGVSGRANGGEMPERRQQTGSEGSPENASDIPESARGHSSRRVSVAPHTLLSIVLAATIVVAIAASRGGARSPTPPVSETPQVSVVRSVIGRAIRLGGLELTVQGVNPAPNSQRYAPTNTATYAVHVSVHNGSTSGEKVTFIPSAFRLVDDAGDVSGVAACMQCPSRFAANVTLAAGTGADGWIYLRLAAGKTADHVLYAPMGAKEIASIALR